MALTETWLKANHGKARERVEEFVDRDAVSVRASAKGKLTFQLRFRFASKAARIDLGSYPQTSLKQARELAGRYRAMIDEGLDPRIEREIERHQRQNELSTSGLFQQFYDGYLLQNKRSHKEVKRSFELYIFPVLGSLPADRLRQAQWLEVLLPLSKRIPTIVQRLLSNGRQMYDWGIRRELISTNPLQLIRSGDDLNLSPNISERTLSNEEIAALWRYMTLCNTNPRTIAFLKLCLIYGCRNGELRLTEAKHLDFEAGIWTIPPENHKTGDKTKKPLVRPIIPETRVLFEQAKIFSQCQYVFTAARNRTTVLPRNNTLCYPRDVMSWLSKHEKFVMEHWSIHDLRRTARTHFSSLTQPHVAEIMLGHIQPIVRRTYDHYDYLPEQAEALQKWCDRLWGIIAPYPLV